MSRLVEHAQRELKIAGWPMTPHPMTEEGAFDYEHEIVKSVLQLVQQFADQHHSGTSASITLELTKKLLNWEALTPLTDDPAEWQLVMTGGWQSQRQSNCFSKDGGKTYYNIDERRKWVSKLYRLIPGGQLRSWVWDRSTFIFHPRHTSAKAFAGSLDKVEQVA